MLLAFFYPVLFFFCFHIIFYRLFYAICLFIRLIIYYLPLPPLK